MGQPEYTTTNRVVSAAFNAAAWIESHGGGLLYLILPFRWLMTLVEFSEKAVASAKEYARPYQPHEKE
jgi:hypothetical protein